MKKRSSLLSKTLMLQKSLFGDDSQYAAPPAPDAGIDEAGRGCLAGPVVAAAVMLPNTYDLPDLADSKCLSASQRERIEGKIKETSVAWAIGISWPREIDEINILQATFVAMGKAIGNLKVYPARLLVDGNKAIPSAILKSFLKPPRFPKIPNQQTIIAGDAHIGAIAAASILAKTFRDRLMTVFARHWPGYGFEKHKGYGTKEHYAAIRALGPTRIHRITFKGVAIAQPHDNLPLCQQ